MHCWIGSRWWSYSHLHCNMLSYQTDRNVVQGNLCPKCTTHETQKPRKPSEPWPGHKAAWEMITWQVISNQIIQEDSNVTRLFPPVNGIHFPPFSNNGNSNLSPCKWQLHRKKPWDGDVFCHKNYWNIWLVCDITTSNFSSVGLHTLSLYEGNLNILGILLLTGVLSSNLTREVNPQKEA